MPMKLKKFEKQVSTKAAQFVECLSHMPAVTRKESSFYDNTAEWVKLVDRGGLFHVNDMLFRCTELRTQEYLLQHLQALLYK